MSEKKHWQRACWLYLCNFILSVLTGSLVYQWFYNQSMQSLSVEHTSVISSVNTAFSQELGDITNVARLANEHLVDIMSAGLRDETEAQLFLRIGRVLNNVSQMRWLNPEGVETVRVNFLADGVQIVPPEQLQDKSTRYYFKQAQQKPAGIMTLSSIDLNMENGVLVTPFQPTVRAILHTFPSHPLGEGFLVINFDLTSLFDHMKTFEETQTQLLISEGAIQWMLHPDAEKEWTASRGITPANIKLAQPDILEKLKNNKAVSLVSGEEDALFSGAALQLRMKHTHTVDPYFILTRTPAEYHGLLVKDALLPGLISFVCCFFIAGLLITRDLKQLSHVTHLTDQLLTEKQDLKSALDKQTRLRDELVESEKMASLGMLVAGVAHELSTPIGGTTMCVSAIDNQLDALEKKISTGLTRSDLDAYVAYTRESVTLSKHNLERVTELIKRFKRLAVDRGSETPVKFSLHRVVGDLVRTLEAQASAKRVKLTADIPETLEIVSFPGLYSQILQNLITNAFEHAFANKRNGEVCITAREKGNSFEVRVRDDGCGILDEIQHTIFEPFVTSARNKGNTGLGMHLVHQWVTNLLGGRIVFTSKEGNGTEFIMTFPMALPDAKKA